MRTHHCPEHGHEVGKSTADKSLTTSRSGALRNDDTVRELLLLLELTLDEFFCNVSGLQEGTKKSSTRSPVKGGRLELLAFIPTDGGGGDDGEGCSVLPSSMAMRRATSVLSTTTGGLGLVTMAAFDDVDEISKKLESYSLRPRSVKTKKKGEYIGHTHHTWLLGPYPSLFDVVFHIKAGKNGGRGSTGAQFPMKAYRSKPLCVVLEIFFYSCALSPSKSAHGNRIHILWYYQGRAKSVADGRQTQSFCCFGSRLTLEVEKKGKRKWL